MSYELDYSEITLKKGISQPLKLQLSVALTQMIRGIPPNETVTLMSERNLSELLKINRATVHAVYAKLLEQGVVTRLPDKSLCSRSDSRQKLNYAFPTIGLVIAKKFSEFIDYNHQIPMFYYRGIVDQASELNMSITMLQLPDPSSEAPLVDLYMNDVISRLNGVIHLGDRLSREDNPLERLLETRGIPQVCVSCTAEQANVGAVLADSASGVAACAEELLRLGHRQMGIIGETMPSRRETYGYFVYEAEDRVARIAEQFRQAGLAIVDRHQFWEDSGEDALLTWLKRLKDTGDLPTVFWCEGDFLAGRVMKHLDHLGIRVPEEVSVVGYNDSPIMGNENPVSSIHLPFYEIGAHAVKMLDDFYRHGMEASTRVQYLSTRFVKRLSVGPAIQR